MGETVPGVNAREENAFPTKVIGVATAVPYFVGYTEKADKLFAPVAVTSLAEYEKAFGGRCTDFQPVADGLAPVGNTDGKGLIPAFMLYDSVALFFANGGAICFVVAVGHFRMAPALKILQKGLDALPKSGPTLIAIPDAIRLGTTDFGTLSQAMLAQAGQHGDRMAILDVPVGLAKEKGDGVYGEHHKTGVEEFRTAISMEDLSYGAAYFPCLWVQLANGDCVQVPASGAVMGMIAHSDATRGVWMAPANIGVHGVAEPSVRITDADQAGLNLDPGTGKSIDAIRTFIGMGTMLWGARTLDGNSNDYRYIQIRRTIIYIEQSIKAALGPFAMAPNAPSTWLAVVNLVNDFLAELWLAGAIIGASARSAYSAQCGLGTTMTADDIADGILRVAVTVALVHPAEFTVITIEQRMTQGSGA